MTKILKFPERTSPSTKGPHFAGRPLREQFKNFPPRAPRTAPKPQQEIKR